MTVLISAAAAIPISIVLDAPPYVDAILGALISLVPADNVRWISSRRHVREEAKRVFISYRRDDTAGYAGRLYEALADRFGEDLVAMDVDTIALGDDVGEVVSRSVESARVMLVLIGPNWLIDAEGVRIERPDDFVHLEVAAGLADRDTRVIPLLVAGAELPSARDLPKGLEALSRLTALHLRDERWRHDVEQLIDAVRADQ